MGKFVERFRRWRAETIARGQLARFDDRLLEDLGIVRGEIPEVVRGLK
jgi:uncharacterized protein YjiS (DUF1127 family)